MHKPQFFSTLSRSYVLALTLVILLMASLTGCEKDDICVDGDTPLLIINFYTSEDSAAAKNVPRLRVTGLGNGNPVGTFSDRSNRDSIGLPLRSDQPNTGFVMIQNSQDDSEGMETGNRDTLYFDYVLSDAFISKACGFVTNYEELQARLQADSTPWIDSVRVVTSSVQSIQTTHVAIYH